MNASTTSNANGTSNRRDQPHGTNMNYKALLVNYEEFLTTATSAQVTAIQAMSHQLPAPNQTTSNSQNITPASDTTTPLPHNQRRQPGRDNNNPQHPQ